MFPGAIFPKSYFPPNYFPGNGKVGGGKGKGYGGIRARLLQAIYDQEAIRHQEHQVMNLEAILKRAVHAKRFREMEEFAIRRANTIAAYSVLFAEL